jgi:pyrroline-5-carboxylate reductase
MTKDTVRVTFIGGGNMAHSLIAGLLEKGWSPATLCVADPLPQQRRRLEEAFGVATTADNRAAIEGADVVLLAVKPQDLAGVSREIAPQVAESAALVISIAAGIRASDVSRWLDGAAVVRAMPNRPALLGSGATALYAPPEVSASQRSLAADILSAVGIVVWIEEEGAMDAVTAVSGSGPAYFFLLIEMLEEAGVALGLEQTTARRLAIETAYGAARMARETDSEPALLREQVTSKGGTTAAALAELESADVRDIFRRAIGAAARRSAELAAEAGQT